MPLRGLRARERAGPPSAALADGTLPAERFESYRKLLGELKHLELKTDARAMAEQRKARRRFARSMRKTSSENQVRSGRHPSAEPREQKPCRHPAPARDQDFALLWAGATVSLAGDGVYVVALAWQVYEFELADGALAGRRGLDASGRHLRPDRRRSDRFERRRIMIAADIVRAVAVATIGILSLTGAIELWHLIVLRPCSARVRRSSARRSRRSSPRSFRGTPAPGQLARPVHQALAFLPSVRRWAA